ncbi:hypothetical protein [Sphingomonas sp. MS122]|uniref:hypothetical protein n=1 Tax=Sphingomonas sp. MS122 TaxID=3412683 RepID=UPI003C2BC6DA
MAGSRNVIALFDPALPRATAAAAGSAFILMLAAGSFAVAAQLVRIVRKPVPGQRSWRALGAALGGAVLVSALALAVMFPAALIGGGALAAMQTPAATYLALALGGGVWLYLATRMNGYGMDGCAKVWAAACAAYLLIWGLVSFWTVGGGALGAGELGATAVKIAAAASPLAVLIARTNRPGRRLRAGLAAGVILGAWAAVVFLTVENGFAGGLLPGSDWLRFPIAGAIGALPLAALGLIAALRRRHGRTRALREQLSVIILLALAAAVSGLSWAVARAAIEP